MKYELEKMFSYLIIYLPRANIHPIGHFLYNDLFKFNQQIHESLKASDCAC